MCLIKNINKYSVLQVFLATLTNLQMRDYLSDVDTWRLFANLNELCLVRPYMYIYYIRLD